MTDKPDLYLIHCHDLGDWLTTYGYPQIPSPNLDAFAATSVVFDRAFATAPLCTPARSSIFTGRLPHENGLMGLTHTGWTYRPDVPTLPEVVRSAGYHSALIGLQHEDLDARVLGFDEVHGLGFIPRALEVATLTERWLAENPDGAPFLLSIGMWEVHRPWPEEDYEPVDPASVRVPDYLPDNEHTRRDISQFYGAIRRMDEAFGRIVAAIDAHPRGRDAVIVFTTDHGVAFPRAKSTLYDSGVKVALMMRAPGTWGVVAGRSDGMVSHLDLLPTLADFAGAKAPDGLSGLVLLDKSGVVDPGDRRLFLEKTYHDRYDPIRAVRTSTAKYIRNFVDAPALPLPTDLELSQTRVGMDDAHLRPRPPEELYLLTDDPSELNNRVDDPSLSALREGLSRELDRHLRSTQDPVLAGAVAPPPAPVRGRRQ
ncbi:sulfatase family protein [Microcella indica]|uniref:sulfatase family protein n=1 Tax=Microcella indica TaxID=2750620 RepID=UPI0015CF1967|nr:sulfatase [Microcella indica]